MCLKAKIEGLSLCITNTPQYFLTSATSSGGYTRLKTQLNILVIVLIK